MGGSSGRRPGSIRKTLKYEAERQAVEARLRSEILSVVADLLSAVNDRNIDTVNEHLADVAEALGDRVEEFESLLYGGSVAKHTYVDGLSDVDSLAILAANEQVQTPEEFLAQFKTTLESTLDMGTIDSISVGNMAITVEYKDGTSLQLLPAIREGDDLKIASSDGKDWNRINPKRFADRLTEVNKNCGRVVVPTIKLAKSALQQQPEHVQLSGYHVEALAVQAFQDYQGPRTSDAALQHLIRSASQAVLSPVPDPTGQSRAIDEHLGEAGSPDRRRVSRALGRLASELENAKSADVWRREIAGE